MGDQDRNGGGETAAGEHGSRRSDCPDKNCDENRHDESKGRKPSGAAALAIGGGGDNINEGASSGPHLFRPEHGVQVDGERGLVDTFVATFFQG